MLQQEVDNKSSEVDLKKKKISLKGAPLLDRYSSENQKCNKIFLGY